MSKEDFLEEDGKWTCRKCAACCFAVGSALPEWDRGDGGCMHLTDDLLCSIFEVRPDMCRTECVSRPLGYSDEQMATACDSLRSSLFSLEQARRIVRSGSNSKG